MNAEEIFHQAVEVPDPTKRTEYLDQVCSGDKRLRAEVDALLRWHEEAGDFLEMPAIGPDVARETSVVTEGPGTVIGRYKLLEKIGEGGMAVVYMAEQQEPIYRKVALKIIKLGMDTRQVIARFEAERQALALMDHPSIAKVLDAGATETGRPYFAMELVQGASITEYCDKNSLNTKERLNLFIQVCHAVQHAHQKGIIHRDIKPSNVMVTHHDGRPVPKVIDFGIAKATNQRLTEKTVFTHYGHLIGTPAYMSPEQAELSDLDIDTRSDIYSLGVLLYELLTGTTPFSEEELRKAGYIEMQRIIREQEPVKPSTKLSTLGDTLTDVAKHRNCTPDLLRKSLRGDLDWIVMKSLEKDRMHRYETTATLAEDIRRHLEHEPILARGPDTVYRLRKFLRRHRSQISVALAMAVATSAAVVVLSLWNRDRLQLAETEGFRDRNVLSQAREHYAKGSRQAALETIQSVLASKHVGPDAQLFCASILAEDRRSDEAVAMLGHLLEDRPAIAGAAHALLARILWENQSPNAEKLPEIEEHRRRAEALLPETAEAYSLRAMTAITIKEQLAFLDKALRLASRDLDPLNPINYESHRLRAFIYYASQKYENMKDDALAMTTLRPGDPLGYLLWAVALRELGQYQGAMAEYDDALARTLKDDPQYLDLTTQRVETLLRMGSYRPAIAAAREALRRWPDRPIFQYDLFAAQTALGDYDAAAAVFARIISSGPEARRPFEDWCTKYIFDRLEVGRPWHPPDRTPVGAAFLPLVEAAETYQHLAAKAKRVITNGHTTRWSPDGKKLVFSPGVPGNSGVAVFDPATHETELLIVPGKDPSWSPDGQYIAFVRDCQVLRVPEFATAERKPKQRPRVEEEVWVMKSDGTEPRRLARGGWPSWSQDSQLVYYQSRLDNALCWISVEGRDASPQHIMPCPNPWPSVSPDGQRVAYPEGGLLKVKDLASQAVVAQWPIPPLPWIAPAWSPTGRELCMGTSASTENRTGLCVFRLDESEPLKVLDSQITIASWAPDGTKLVFHLGAPYFEIWTADLDPKISLAEALGLAQTINEHWRDLVTLYTRRIEADPQDAYAYFDRARYYDSLHEREKATTDVRRWSAIMSGRSPSEASFGAPRDLRWVLNLPFGCQFVFSAERPVNTIPMMSVAFGQKGRCEMKLFEIPMVVTSLVGLCFLTGLDAPPARADFTFGAPVNIDALMPFLASSGSIVTSLTADGLEMYIESYLAGGQGGADIAVLKRASPEDDWGPPENLGPIVNSARDEAFPFITADGLELYFDSNRSGNNYVIYVARRATRDSPWGPPTNLGPNVNSSYMDGCPSVSSDGLELYFVSTRPSGYGGMDIYVSKRATRNDPWGPASNLGPAVNSPAGDTCPCISPDGLLLFLQDYGALRPGGYGGGDLWLSRRASRSVAWEPAVNLGPIINGPGMEARPCLAPDGSALYFVGGNTLTPLKAPILPIVDFNGDEKVDIKDLLRLIESWGKNDPSVDIGPTPFGDGVVDEKDLEVLMSYWGKEVLSPALAAYWRLDEADGLVAADSVGHHDGELIGNPIWQPSGGRVGGALQLDGVDDYIKTPSILDPSTGPFSVGAWVKGDSPGQTILSQENGADWLLTDAPQGRLMTSLSAPAGRFPAKPLVSESVITDGQWHRVGFVWDGSNRILYVDDVEVKKDTQSSLAASPGGLHIGAGSKLAVGTFWSGLIDDVRIYNRAVKP